MLHNVYLCCLAIGAIYSFITTFVLGLVSNIDLGHMDGIDVHVDGHIDGLDVHLDGHVDGHIDGHVDGHIDGHTDLGSSLSLPIRPFTVMIFVTVFGGSGLILLNYVYDKITIPLSLFIAYVISKFMYHTVYMNLRKMQTTTKNDLEAIGMEADVIESIPVGGTGRISYVLDKNILSGAAKEWGENLIGIKKGNKVLIVGIKDNINYVEILNKEEKK